LKNKFFKKLISSLLIAVMLFSSYGAAFGATASATTDIKGHWAESQISSWIDKGLIKGYEDGSFKPENQITRAEFIALVNRSFGFTEKAAISFGDVPADNWAYPEIAIAVKAGYITGYEDGTIGAAKPISRQEVAAIVDRLLDLSKTESAATSFTDSGSIALWAKGSVDAAVAKGILKGYAEDNSFKPGKSITRAEAVVTLDRAVAAKATVYSAAGTYGPATGTETINGNVVVSVPNVTLQNLIIAGDLTLAEGIGNGDAFLNHVTVKGKTNVNGGGENSIHFKDSTILTIIINKPTGTVRVVAEGATTVQQVNVESPTTIQETGTTGSGFSKVTLSEVLPADSKVTLKGSFDTLDVKGDKIKVDIPEGSVKEVNAASTSTGMELNLGADAKINNLNLDAPAKLVGTGTIETATLNAVAKADTTFEKQPDKKEDKVEGTATPTPTPAPTATPSPTNSGQTPTVVSKTALVTAISVTESVYSSAVVGTAVGEYTQSFVNTVYGAITTAKVVYNNSSATQTDVDSATTTLNTARTTFLAAAIQANKAALTSAITAAQSVSSSAVIGIAVNQFTQINIDTLNAAITAAQAVKDNMLSSQGDVDSEVTTLNSAVTTFQATAVTQTAAGFLFFGAVTNADAGSTKSLDLYYELGEDYTNGKVAFTIPVGFIPTVTNVTYDIRGFGASVSVDISGQIVTISGLNGSQGAEVSFTLDSLTIPAPSTYTFSATGDADGAGTSKTPSAGTGTDTDTFTSNVPGASTN
jgi:hypothetical protein